MQNNFICINIILDLTDLAAGHVARVEKDRNACRILLGKPEEKIPLRRRKL
jgi:hypothetical protein